MSDVSQTELSVPGGGWVDPFVASRVPTEALGDGDRLTDPLAKSTAPVDRWAQAPIGAGDDQWAAPSSRASPSDQADGLEIPAQPRGTWQSDHPQAPEAVKTFPEVPIDISEHNTSTVSGIGPESGSPTLAPSTSAFLDARQVSCWFGKHKVLERVSLEMLPGRVTALIGPSGCGKSTFLRTLNRMHELIPGAAMAGQVLLDDVDIYGSAQRITESRLRIGMVFQKPNPFPSMTIAQNVLAGLRLSGTKVADKDGLVEECLTKAGLWKETRNRLNTSGAALSGGQQQRLCIARALAVRPKVLLMDEPCSALDPISTGVIEQTIAELSGTITIVIVTHNMQQAQRVSDNCALFLVDGEGLPGRIVEYGPTPQVFNSPTDHRTEAYVNGRFG